jgi:hypothetical protein
MAGICSYCGLPSGVGKGNRWHPNGVIASRYPPFMRETLYDVQELNDLVGSLSERMGLDISPLVIEGKRKDAKRYAKFLIENMKNRDDEIPSALDFYGLVNQFGRVWGLARGRLIEYQERKSLSLEMDDVYCIPMAKGDWAGICEAVEGMRMDAVWEGDENHGMMHLIAVEGEPELAQRIEAEVELGVPYVEQGDLWDMHYKRCPECEVPLDVSKEFFWDVERARITERETGKRFAMHYTNGTAAVVRMLQKELAEDVDRLLIDISRDYARGYYPSLVHRSSLVAELIKFASRSWGRLSGLSHREDGLVLEVTNAYCTPIVIGRIWGLAETFERKIIDLTDFSEEAGVARLMLKPVA